VRVTLARRMKDTANRTPTETGRLRGSCCTVCGVADARALVVVVLRGGARATLCGTHALMHRRSAGAARTPAELRVELRDRRGRRDRRDEGDALGDALTAAFHAERRAVRDRRSA
jgi:hypothetical protein